MNRLAASRAGNRTQAVRTNIVSCSRTRSADASRIPRRYNACRFRRSRRLPDTSPLHRIPTAGSPFSRDDFERRDAAVVSRRRLFERRTPSRFVGKATSRRPELVHDSAGMRARIVSAREGGAIMKLVICIAILFLALAGGVASAITAQLLPAHADPCGGYSCETAGVSDDFRRGS
jgi:hypothetical protein